MLEKICAVLGVIEEIGGGYSKWWMKWGKDASSLTTWKLDRDPTRLGSRGRWSMLVRTL